MDYQMELSHLGENEEERKLANDMYELLTPIIKSYLANRGYEVCVQAMQVYAGAGYTNDYLVEQYVRDCKIVSIYEGTCGIQAMDLLGRKMGMEGGKVFMAFLGEILKIVAAAKEVETTKDLAERVEKMVNKLGEVAAHLGKNAMSLNYKTAFAHSLPYLDVMGDTIMAWMLLWRAMISSQKLENKPKKKDMAFYEGQIKSAEFFIQAMVPTTMGRMDSILDLSSAAIDISDEGFGGL
jgi:tartrate dehydratase beta subunit/fumarate hydratase class I family protein